MTATNTTQIPLPFPPPEGWRFADGADEGGGVALLAPPDVLFGNHDGLLHPI